MSWRWRSFERRMGARVKPYDARRAMNFWRKVGHYLSTPFPLPLWLLRTLVSLCLAGVMLSNAGSVAQYPECWMAGLGWCGLVGAFPWTMVSPTGSISAGVAATVYPPRGLWILPLSADAIFRHFCRRRGFGAVWGVLEFLLLYGLVAGGAGHTASAWAGAVAGAVMQGFLWVGLGFVILAARLNRNSMVIGVGLCAYVSCAVMACATPELGCLVGRGCNLLNPMGWVSTVYLEGCLRGQGQAWWFLAPVLLVLGAARLSLPLVRRRHHQEAFREVSPAQGHPLFLAADEARCRAEEKTASGQSLADDGFARPVPWQRLGWIERWLPRLLSERESLVAECLSAHQHRLSAAFTRLILYLGFYWVANQYIQYGSFQESAEALHARPARFLIPCLASLIFGALTLAKVFTLFCWAEWPERVRRTEATSWPDYRSFRLLPMSHWEAAKVIAKVNTSVALLLVAPATLFALSPACRLVLKLTSLPAAMPLKPIFLCWASFLVLPTFNLLPPYQASLKFWLSAGRTTLVMFAFIGLGLLFLAMPGSWLEGVVAAVIGAGAVGWLAYCGHRYQAGRFV